MFGNINKTTILNAGLFAVGSKKIFQPTDNTKSARLATEIYEYMRQVVFELPYDWKWCMARSEQLAQLADPPTGFDHQYALPDNAVRAVSLVNPDTGMDRDRGELEFSFEPGLLVTTSGDNTSIRRTIQTNVDATEAFVKYLVFIEDEGMYPAWFAQLISLNIAIYIAEPLKQHTPHYNKVKDMLKNALSFAIEANAKWGVSTLRATAQSKDKGTDSLVNAGRLGLEPRTDLFYWPL